MALAFVALVPFLMFSTLDSTLGSESVQRNFHMVPVLALQGFPLDFHWISIGWAREATKKLLACLNVYFVTTPRRRRRP